MYLHIGQSTVLNDRDIIGVFDLDNASSSRITRDFLKKAEEAGELESLGGDIPKSFVLCEDGDGQRVYLSQLGTATLRSRGEMFGQEK